MPSYNDLKNELVDISLILEKFPDDLKPKVFDVLISNFLGEKIESKDIAEAKEKLQKTQDRTESTPRSNPPTKRKSKNKSYKIDRDLNLRGGSETPSFKDFCEEKNPSSNQEFNVVAVYYLQKIVGVKNITLDQVYTCYTEVSRKPAQHFRQSFTDAKNKLGYIEFNEDNFLAIPHRGIIFVEHDLPKEDKTKSKTR